MSHYGSNHYKANFYANFHYGPRGEVVVEAPSSGGYVKVNLDDVIRRQNDDIAFEREEVQQIIDILFLTGVIK